MTLDEKKVALAHLGVGYTTRGDEIETDGPMPSQADLDAAFAEATAPQPDPDDEFRKAVEAATSIADLKAALLGTSGPGAEPRR